MPKQTDPGPQGLQDAFTRKTGVRSPQNRPARQTKSTRLQGHVKIFFSRALGGLVPTARQTKSIKPVDNFRNLREYS